MSSYHDVIISSIGDFGLAQALIIAAAAIPKLTAAWSILLMSFGSIETDWWRVTRNINATGNASDSIRVFKDCNMKPGDTIEFDTSIITVVNEWGLVCGKDWIPTTITTTQMIGVLIGAAVGGQLGEIVGRRKTLIIMLTLKILAVTIEGTAANWYVMIAAIFFVGLSFGGFFVINNVYMLEFVGTKYRTPVGVIPMWGLGMTLMGVLYKFSPNWRHICYVAVAIEIPCYILLWISPESIRWLFTQREFEEGKKKLVKLSKMNRRPLPDFSNFGEVVNKEESSRDDGHKYTYLSLFKFKSTRMLSVILGYIWFCQSYTYYGLTLGVGHLVGDPAVNMMIMGSTDVLCMAIVAGISGCCGRKYTTIILMTITAVATLGITVAYFINTDKFSVIMSVLALSAQFTISGAWMSVIVYTTELYPTVVRSVGYGFASICARVGSIVAPQINTMRKISIHLPYTVSGIMMLICCVLVLSFKETAASPLEDHVEKSEKEKDIELTDPTKIELTDNCYVVNEMADER